MIKPTPNLHCLLQLLVSHIDIKHQIKKKHDMYRKMKLQLRCPLRKLSSSVQYLQKSCDACSVYNCASVAWVHV